MELYNEEVTDLLSYEEARDTTAFNGSSSSSTLADGKARLRLLEDRSGVVVQGLEEMVVRSATEIYQVGRKSLTTLVWCGCALVCYLPKSARTKT